MGGLLDPLLLCLLELGVSLQDGHDDALLLLRQVAQVDHGGCSRVLSLASPLGDGPHSPPCPLKRRVSPARPASPQAPLSLYPDTHGSCLSLLWAGACVGQFIRTVQSVRSYTY